MLVIKFQLTWTNSYVGWTVTMRTHPGISGKSDFGESNHKVAEFIFCTNRETRGQGDAGPKSADFNTGGETMRKLLEKQDNQHSAGKSCKGTGCFILPGERQKTRQPTLTLVVLLQTQGQQHRAEGGGNRGSSLLICSKNHLIAKPHGKG